MKIKDGGQGRTCIGFAAPTGGHPISVEGGDPDLGVVLSFPDKTRATRGEHQQQQQQHLQQAIRGKLRSKGRLKSSAVRSFLGGGSSCLGKVCKPWLLPSGECRVECPLQRPLPLLGLLPFSSGPEQMMVSWTPEMELPWDSSIAVVAQTPSQLSVASEEEGGATGDGLAF